MWIFTNNFLWWLYFVDMTLELNSVWATKIKAHFLDKRFCKLIHFEIIIKWNNGWVIKTIFFYFESDYAGKKDGTPRAMALLVFVRLVNPKEAIPTMGVNKAHYITTAPPQIKFWTFHCLWNMILKLDLTKTQGRSGGTVDWPQKIQTTNLFGPFWLSVRS